MYCKGYPTPFCPAPNGIRGLTFPLQSQCDEIMAAQCIFAPFPPCLLLRPHPLSPVTPLGCSKGSTRLSGHLSQSTALAVTAGKRRLPNLI